MGPVAEGLADAQLVVVREASSVNDNPLVDPAGGGSVWHTGEQGRLAQMAGECLQVQGAASAAAAAVGAAPDAPSPQLLMLPMLPLANAGNFMGNSIARALDGVKLDIAAMANWWVSDVERLLGDGCAAGSAAVLQVSLHPFPPLPSSALAGATR